jgi:hypothetical protein
MSNRANIARIRASAFLAALIASPLLSAQVTCDAIIFADQFEVPTPASIRINEIASNPIDWVELNNPGDASIDIGGWSISDNTASNAEFLPAATVVPAGCYFTLHPSFGLGSADSAILRNPSFEVVDSYSWTNHATASYSRCPNGSGPFVNAVTATEGSANSCP